MEKNVKSAIFEAEEAAKPLEMSLDLRKICKKKKLSRPFFEWETSLDKGYGFQTTEAHTPSKNNSSTPPGFPGEYQRNKTN